MGTFIKNIHFLGGLGGGLGKADTQCYSIENVRIQGEGSKNADVLYRCSARVLRLSWENFGQSDMTCVPVSSSSTEEHSESLRILILVMSFLNPQCPVVATIANEQHTHNVVVTTNISE